LLEGTRRLAAGNHVIRITAHARMGRYKTCMSRSFFRPMLADWKRWSLAERIAAVLLLAGILLLQVPLIL
jgi:hypothetical protein